MTGPQLIREAEGETISIGGSHIRVLLGLPGFSLFEERTDPGQGPPLHIHHDAEEFFRVIEGSFRFRLGDETLRAGPGDALVVPRGLPHTFVNDADAPGMLHIGFQPGGPEGFFRAFGAKGLTLPDDMDEIVALARSFEVELCGPNPLVGEGQTL